MTQTKLEIIGPYTPEHQGPFCVGVTDPVPVELRVRDGRGEFPLHGYISRSESLSKWRADGTSPIYANLMDAREVLRGGWGMSEELKSCPFCGSSLVELINDVWGFVTCNNCGGTGPECCSSYKAIEAWNARAGEKK